MPCRAKEEVHRKKYEKCGKLGGAARYIGDAFGIDRVNEEQQRGKKKFQREALFLVRSGILLQNDVDEKGIPDVDKEIKEMIAEGIKASELVIDQKSQQQKRSAS